MPWFHRMRAKLSLPDKVISFQHDDQEVKLRVDEKGHTIPLVSHVSIHKAIKFAAFAYMVYVKDTSLNSSSSNLSNLSQGEINQKVFLDEYASCFTDSIPGELPPSRGVDDHRIDLIPGTTLPNKPPYRISLPQQEEIIAQVNELVEKGIEMNTLTTSYVFQAPHRLAIYGGMVLMAIMMLHVCDSIVSQTLCRILFLL